MFANEVGGFGQWLSTTPLADDRFWQRPLERISEVEIQLFYARARLKGCLPVAREAIDKLQAALITGALDGSVPSDALAIVSHEVPPERFTVEEFIDCLVMLPQARRSAVIFALATKRSPEDVVCMEWREVPGLNRVNALARDVLRQRAKLRHLRLPYVFWEWVSEVTAAPLLNLQTQAELAFDAAWPVIQYRWDEMIWIDGRADVESFKRVVETAH